RGPLRGGGKVPPAGRAADPRLLAPELHGLSRRAVLGGRRAADHRPRDHPVPAADAAPTPARRSAAPDRDRARGLRPLLGLLRAGHRLAPRAPDPGPHLPVRVRAVAVDLARVDRSRPRLDVGAAGQPRAPRALSHDHERGGPALPRRLRGLGLGPRHPAASLARLQARLRREQTLDRARDHELPRDRVRVLPAQPLVLPRRGASRAGGLASGAWPALADALLRPPPAG